MELNFLKPVLLAAAAHLTSCTKKSGLVAGVNETNRMMVVHTSAKAPAVVVFVNNAAAIRNLAFPGKSGYSDLNAGPIT